DAAAPGARKALGELCQTYWYPLYAYVRRQGHDRESAEDLTQEFVARLLEKDGFASAEPGRGRFRSFLMVACRNFLANEYPRATARKRGGGRRVLSLDFTDAEGRYTREPGHGLTAERLFDRRWALALLDAVLERLRREYLTAGKGELFERLKGHLTGEGSR